MTGFELFCYFWGFAVGMAVSKIGPRQAARRPGPCRVCGRGSGVVR